MPSTWSKPTRPWRGVNLGGWLLLEPGPSAAIFNRHKERAAEMGRPLRCEWSLMAFLRAEGAVSEILEHRETHITRDDFARIAGCGLNAVRLPIGYWVVLGSSVGEPYVGPALEYVDRAIKWAEEFDLQVLLDLHGCPGGESSGAPCGRHQMPGNWHWSDWNFAESLRALRLLAGRYKDRPAVTGIGVCNEPSPHVPLDKLCAYYAQAVRTIRDAGMCSSRVAVVLPAFQRPLKEVARVWDSMTGGEHSNVCFDLHYYHCFGRTFNAMTLAQQLRRVEAQAIELSRFPTVVSEWSLALGEVAKLGFREQSETRKLFGASQLAANQKASHGWFFWTWKDGAGVEWDWQQSYDEGSLSSELPRLPAWNRSGEDPLEEMLNPPPAEPDVCFGDAVFLRSFRGTYLDVEGCAVRARWADKGDWQRVILCQPTSSQAALGQVVRHGSIVRLLVHTGHYLSVNGDELSTCPPNENLASTEFVVRMKRTGSGLRHRSVVYLQSKASQRVIDCDAQDDNVRARWNHLGEWQGLALEKEQPAVEVNDSQLNSFLKPRQLFQTNVEPSSAVERSGADPSAVKEIPTEDENQGMQVPETLLEEHRQLSEAQQMPAPRRCEPAPPATASDDCDPPTTPRVGAKRLLAQAHSSPPKLQVRACPAFAPPSPSLLKSTSSELSSAQTVDGQADESCETQNSGVRHLA